MRIILFVGAFFIPIVSFAGVIITEIMYDPDGNDTGREWVEIYNNGDEDIDITNWRFEEADTNHKLKLFSGDGIISAGGYGVIADNPEMFLGDFPIFSGVLFDSSFSLRQQNQIGEMISLKDAELNIFDTVIYDPLIGGGNDGNSLQLSGGVWIAAIPTPGAPSLGVQEEDAPEEIPLDAQSAVSSGGNAVWIIDENEISVRATAPKTLVAGAPGEFRGVAYGFSGEQLEKAKYAWAFGDGAYEFGQSIFHTYKHPGSYVVFLSAESGKYFAADRITLAVGEANIIISDARAGKNGFIELTNKSNTEIDLSGWIIFVGTEKRILPKNTILLQNSSVKFSFQTLGLEIDSITQTSIYYPGGFLAYSYEPVLQTKDDFIHKDTIAVKPPDIPIFSVKKEILEDGKTEQKTKEFFQATSSSASVLYSSSDTENAGEISIGIWLFGALSLSFLGLAGMIFTRARFSDTDNIIASSDEYEIIEYDENK